MIRFRGVFAFWVVWRRGDPGVHTGRVMGVPAGGQGRAVLASPAKIGRILGLAGPCKDWKKGWNLFVDPYGPSSGALPSSYDPSGATFGPTAPDAGYKSPPRGVFLTAYRMRCNIVNIISWRVDAVH